MTKKLESWAAVEREIEALNAKMAPLVAIMDAPGVTKVDCSAADAKYDPLYMRRRGLQDVSYGVSKRAPETRSIADLLARLRILAGAMEADDVDCGKEAMESLARDIERLRVTPSYAVAAE